MIAECEKLDRIHDEQYRIRLKIITLTEDGVTIREISERMEISIGYISRIQRDYRYNGIEALAIYRSGNAWGNEMVNDIPKQIQF